MIAMGIKERETRSHLPSQSKGSCGISCLKSSDSRGHANFLAWTKQFSDPKIYVAIPSWEQVEDWQGKMIATCDYEASEEPGLPIWNVGYRYWWKLSNVKMLDEQFAVRGNVGMWEVVVGISY